MLCDAIFCIFWLYTTSDSFVKDAELEYVVETIPEKTEETKEGKDKFEDINIAGILGRSRKHC